MPIGKDSIKKRVAKVDTTAEVTTAEVAAEKAPAKKAPAKKATTTKKSASSTAKKPSTKKAPVATEAPVAAEPATAVLSNVAPETVAAVIGHEEGTPSNHVSIGDKMPNYLL